MLIVAKRTIGLGLVAVAIAMVVAGCSRPGTAPTVPAAGILLLADKPLADVSIVFVPTSGRPAYGVTNAAGKFTMSTFRRDDGAVAGNHRVMLDVPDPGRPEAGTPEARSYRPKPLPFAARYGAIATTDLEVSLPAAGSTNLVLRLKP